MEKREIYQALEKDFVQTFLPELMPGILHNFANPLNGIMGRAKLLQKRMEDAFQKITSAHPETANAFQNELQKLRNDVAAINRESESFYDIFRDASGKFYTLTRKGDEIINISDLLAAEMRFANFYLEFKHEIVKKIELNNYLPDIKGNSAELALVFWRLIRLAMSRALKSEKKEFYLKTGRVSQNIQVVISHSGQPLSPEELGRISQCFQGIIPEANLAEEEKGVLWAMLMLKKYSALAEFYTNDDLQTMAVTIPGATSG